MPSALMRLPILLFLVFVGLLGLGCSSTDQFRTDTAEGLFGLAEKYRKDERFEESVQTFRQLKNKHPYSRFATEAELKIADIEFERDNYVEAEAAYKVFKEFHPRHEKIDYVTYRIGMCIYKQLPSTIDRDLSIADRAIQYFDEVVQSYPSSTLVPAAKDHRAKTLRMQAEKEAYIANFYFIRDMYDSALGRFDALLKRFPNSGLEKKALYGATVSAYRTRDKRRARTYFLELEKQFPQSEETQNARKELTNE